MFEQIVFKVFWVISNVSKENKIKVDHSDFIKTCGVSLVKDGECNI